MSESEKGGPHDEAIKQAIDRGDPTEVERLHLSDQHVAWVRKRAFNRVRELIKSEPGWPTWRILLHVEAVQRRCEMVCTIAKADRNNLRKRIAELEVRFGALKQSATTYCGVWREDSGPYAAGSLATHKGGLWHCREVTFDRPGTSDAWQLTSKTHGKDER